MCPLCVCPRGVRQVEGARARLEDNLYEMSKPLTRTEDDVDRENLLKDQVSHLKGQSYDNKNVQASHQNEGRC